MTFVPMADLGAETTTVEPWDEIYTGAQLMGRLAVEVDGLTAESNGRRINRFSKAQGDEEVAS